MSHTYHFLCVDCQEVFDLGKAVNLDENGQSIPWQFNGFRDQDSTEWIAKDSLWSLIQVWLLNHIGHEIRIVPESYLDRIDTEGKLNYLDSCQDILSKRANINPDDFSDAALIPKKVAIKLLQS